MVANRSIVTKYVFICAAPKLACTSPSTSHKDVAVGSTQCAFQQKFISDHVADPPCDDWVETQSTCASHSKQQFFIEHFTNPPDYKCGDFSSVVGVHGIDRERVQYVGNSGAVAGVSDFHITAVFDFWDMGRAIGAWAMQRLWCVLSWYRNLAHACAGIVMAFMSFLYACSLAASGGALNAWRGLSSLCGLWFQGLHFFVSASRQAAWGMRILWCPAWRSSVGKASAVVLSVPHVLSRMGIDVAMDFCGLGKVLMRPFRAVCRHGRSAGISVSTGIMLTRNSGGRRWPLCFSLGSFALGSAIIAVSLALLRPHSQALSSSGEVHRFRHLDSPCQVRINAVLEAKARFTEFDVNADGLITLSELHHANKKLAWGLSKHFVKIAMDVGDSNGSASLSLEEWVNFLTKHVPKCAEHSSGAGSHVPAVDVRFLLV